MCGSGIPVVSLVLYGGRPCTFIDFHLVGNNKLHALFHDQCHAVRERRLESRPATKSGSPTFGSHILFSCVFILFFS